MQQGQIKGKQDIKKKVKGKKKEKRNGRWKYSMRKNS